MAKQQEMKPLDTEITPGHGLKGVSTLYDKDGKVSKQWVKTSVDSDVMEVKVREMYSAMADKLPKAKPVKLNKGELKPSLLTNYIIGDAHLGMYAWAEETGEDFDLDIAERDLCAAMDNLVYRAPKSEEALIIQLGDFLHIDDRTGQTPASKNVQDFDSRLLKILRVAVRTMRYLINQALKKHAIVRVRNVAGNHDPHSSMSLILALIGHYDNEPRVIIEDSPKVFWTNVFGNNLVGITHGDTIKHAKMRNVLAVEAKDNWHRPFKYCWHGHIHHKSVSEDMGVVTESFRTLAGRDAWHASMGYHSGQEMSCIVLDAVYGEIERYTCGINLARS
jgi:hypothetical protein